MSLAGVKAVSLPDDGTVRIRVLVIDQRFDLTFFRNRVSASNPHQLIVNMIFFGAIFSMNIFVDLRDMDMFSKPKVFKIYHFFDL